MEIENKIPTLESLKLLSDKIGDNVYVVKYFRAGSGHFEHDGKVIEYEDIINAVADSSKTVLLCSDGLWFINVPYQYENGAAFRSMGGIFPARTVVITPDYPHGYIEDDVPNLAPYLPEDIGLSIDIQTYTGNGTSVKTINLTYTPKFVLLYAINKNNHIYDSENSVNKIYSGYAVQLGDLNYTSGGVTIKENAVQLTNNRNPVGGTQMLFNESGTSFIMVLFK